MNETFSKSTIAAADPHTSANMMEACGGLMHQSTSRQASLTLQHLLLTFLVLSVFVLTKSYFNHWRKRLAKCSVFVIGAGPTGITAALIASKSKHVKKLTLFEEMDRSSLLTTDYQVAFNQRTREFLATLGVDFDSLEGVQQDNIFHTRIGVYLEYVLDLLNQTPRHLPVTIRYGTKFTRDHVTAEIENSPGRKLVIAADGSSGQAARLLGLSDEFLNTSCNAYGAVASFEKAQQHSAPKAERRVHGVHFDLSAYGIDQEQDDMANGAGGFSLKLFGTSSHRHLSLALPISDGVLVRKMRLVLDRSMMRNIFTACYNMCKWSDETEITDTWAIRYLTFSPRLFDIKLFQRLETVAFFQDTDVFVVVEGEAARCTNFNTGLDINMAIAGLFPLRSVVKKVACAFTDVDMTDAMALSMRHTHSLCKRYVRDGLQQDMLRVPSGAFNK